MARERTSPQRPGSKKRPSGTNTRKARPKRITSPALADRINQLKNLVERRKQDIVTASWDLGKLAAAILKQAERGGDTQLTTHKLAEDIGLIKKPDSTQKKTDDSTLRQMIKFADRVHRNTAARLQKAGVSWRGVMNWLSVEDGQDSRDLLHRMLAGLKNSTDIRRYIADNLNRKPRPRFSENLTEACQQVQTRVEGLIMALDGFEQAYEKRWTSLSLADRKEARSSLRDLDKVLRHAGDLIKSVRARRRRGGSM